MTVRDRPLTDRERAQVTERIRRKAAEAAARFRAIDPRRYADGEDHWIRYHQIRSEAVRRKRAQAVTRTSNTGARR